jgi:hypothetical protein
MSRSGCVFALACFSCGHILGTPRNKVVHLVGDVVKVVGEQVPGAMSPVGERLSTSHLVIDGGITAVARGAASS